MNRFHYNIPENRLLSGFKATQAAIDALEKALWQHAKDVMSFIWAAVLISMCLSMMSFFVILTETPTSPMFAVLAGFATALLNGGFWHFMFKRARDAKTPLGVAIVLALFLTGGTTVTVISAGSSVPALIQGSSNEINQTSDIQAFSKVINDTNLFATNLKSIRATLQSREANFNTRFDDEVKGRGITKRPGEGFVSNALLEAKNLFAIQGKSLDAGLIEFDKLKSQLDQKFAEWQEAQRSGGEPKKGFDEYRTEVSSLIAQIAAINPKALAENIANQIAININLPSGAKRFQLNAIEDIQDEIDQVASNIRASAKGFATIQIPEKQVASKFTLAWQNAAEFWPLVLLCFGIDLISPLLFLMKLPGFLAIHAQQRALMERQDHIRSEMRFHRQPTGSDIFGEILSDVEGIMTIHDAFMRRTIKRSVRGIDVFPLENDFYAGIGQDDDNIINGDYEDIGDGEIEDIWDDEETTETDGKEEDE